MTNSPTAFFDTVTGPIRVAETIAGQFAKGTNVGASNSPGIGIADAGNVATQNLAESLPQWTLLDQHGAARAPQNGQLIGGNGLGVGVTGLGTLPIGMVTNNASGDGSGVTTGVATLADLAVGWTAVAVP